MLQEMFTTFPLLRHITGSFKEATSSFIALEDMDSDVAIILIDWIQEDRCTTDNYQGKAFEGTTSFTQAA